MSTQEVQRPGHSEKNQLLVENTVATTSIDELNMWKKRYDDLEKELKLSKRTTEYLRARGKVLENRVIERKQAFIELTKELNIMKRKTGQKHGICQAFLNVSKKVFTESQCKMLIDSKRKVEWDSDSLYMALCLRSISKRTYIFLRQNVNYPLPSLAFLQTWASTINLRQGILLDVLTILKAASRNLSNLDKVTVLQFDTFKVTSAYEYDKKTDEVIGPYQKVQIGLARGLCSEWKQPVYIDFNSNIDKNTLLSLVEKLHEAGYIVIACTFDMDNITGHFWHSLGVTIEEPWFSHPVKSDLKIHFFLDASHLLKLLCNQLFLTGFVFPDGSTISRKSFHKIVTLKVWEHHAWSPIIKNWVECEQDNEFDSSLAAELLSHATAIVIRQYNLEEVYNLADFIDVISSWYNIMTSRNDSHRSHFMSSKRVGYGNLLEDQNLTLDKMYYIINSIKCIDGQDIGSFQEGFLISIKALRNLLPEMMKLYGVKYIMTHRLGQEALKTFYMQVQKPCDSNNHPTPLTLVNNIRKIMIYKNKGQILSEEDLYLVADTLDKAHVVLKEETITSDEGDVALLEIPSPEFGESFITGLINSDVNMSLVNYELLETSEDGQTYVGGWVAKKHAKQCPQLGVSTYELTIDHAYAFPSLIEQLSCGDLIEPSQEWLQIVKQLEAAFVQYHGKEKIQRGSGVTRIFADKLLQMFPHVDSEVLRSFVCVRTFIRLRYLNAKYSMTGTFYGKRKLDSDNSTNALHGHVEKSPKFTIS